MSVHSDDADQITGVQALELLLEGNRRFVAGRLQHPHQAPSRRAEIADGQHPFATILTCSDSRVPPEIVFDQGLGDLFTVRVAGNVADRVTIGSIEYAVEHLGTELVMILGHQRCGAVAAASSGGKVRGHVRSIVRKIEPAVTQEPSSVPPAGRHSPGDPLDGIVRANAVLQARHLAATSRVLSDYIKEGRLVIVAAHYDVESGRVTVLEQPVGG